MPDFEVYQRQHSANPKRRGATVTVMSRGAMSFSEPAWTALGSPEAVRFLVATGQRERLVGFRACERGGEDAHAVTRANRMVSARPVLRHVGADLSVSRRYTLHVEDGLPPYIDLDEDAPAVTSNRRKAAAV